MKKTETKSTVLLKHHLKALRLPTMAAECEEVARRCAAEDVDHLGLLLQLCELELIERERRAAQRRLKAARFPTVKTLEAFGFASAPTLNKPLVLELARCGFVERRENLLLVGGPGPGKTHLATALGVEACGRGKRVRFCRATELVTQLLGAREERQLGQLRSRLAKLDLLIPDGLGYVPASKAGAELLFDVIGTAYERTSAVVTTDLPFEQWPGVLGSERLTGAALDRLTHRCTILETGGESYRPRDARRRRRSPGAEAAGPPAERVHPRSCAVAGSVGSPGSPSLRGIGTEGPHMRDAPTSTDRHDELRRRWLAHAAAAFDLMFHPDHQADLVTFDQREARACELGRDLTTWLIQQHANADPQARPAADREVLCPRCGRPARRKTDPDTPPPGRRLTGLSGEVELRREQWACTACRVVFFPPGP